MNQNQAGELLIFGAVALIVLVMMARRRVKLSTTACGTARLATRSDLKRAGMLSGGGLVLGRTRGGELIRMRSYTHLSVFAPTGAGKGVSCCVPWLRTYRRGSCLVVDPKGENYRLTSELRRKMGQTVIRLDPFGVCGPGADSFNPLALIGDGPECVDEARSLAEAMVIRTGEEKDPHFNDQAANVFSGLLACVLSEMCDEERNLTTLREMLTDAVVSENALAALRAKGGVFARLAGVIGQLEDKEKASVYSTAHRHSAWLDSEAIIESISKSNFDATELLKGNMTIYLILPPHQMEAQVRWLRMVIASLFRMIGCKGMAKGNECLAIIDEAGQIGHMGCIDQGLTILRYTGLRMAFFFQSLGQLKEGFKGKEAILLDNTEQIYFGVNSLETAERVSKMLGTKTIALESANEGYSRSHQQGGANQNGGANVSWSSGSSVAVQPREVLKPDEVLQLPGHYLIAFLRNLPPVLCRRCFWYREKEFGGRSSLQQLSVLWWVFLAVALTIIGWAVWR